MSMKSPNKTQLCVCVCVCVCVFLLRKFLSAFVWFSRFKVSGHDQGDQAQWHTIPMSSLHKIA